ncbi:glutamyl-tRNA reductase [Salinisphaera japonica]|uniref:Glutamyl-tRNA reductase n=1 Tax=Salinisphaera japonica YTM-1 TaxID=1209778 RepID=A0A423PIR8_9GAMM|nr:glutamyl-tRNA reductase [Salinisphaera japonica]ROO25472.1 glutamyl-tRNA reductase [Salinisphaera japonica YTM-1]
MSLLTVGLNHNTAALSIREAVAFPADQFASALDDFLRLPQIREGAILSTCNRTELYAIIDDGLTTDDDAGLRAWLAAQRGLDLATLQDCFYIHRGREVVRHSLCVAAGLDSMILGEPQILGQMKDAYRTAQAARGTGTLLTRLFEHSFTVAKSVRSQTEIGASPVSVAYAGVSLARQIFTDVSESCALMIGAGDTIELTARYLAEIGVSRMIFANRSLDKAQELATRYHGYALSLADVPTHLAEADLLIASTAAPSHIVTADQIKKALRKRRRKPMFALDLAVPRDIEPSAAKFEDLYLYTVDDLQSVIDDNKRSRQAAAEAAHAIIDARIDQYLEWVDARQATATIREIRAGAEAKRDQAIARARRRLARGEDADAVMADMARILTNKLMHEPTATLRKAVGARQQRLLGPARELFELGDEADDTPSAPGPDNPRETR